MTKVLKRKGHEVNHKRIERLMRVMGIAATLRWQLIETAGRVIRHGRRLILRLATTWEKYALFLQMRRRLKAFGGL